MSVDLVRIVDSIHRDKNISKEILFDGIQSALATAARKHYPDAAEIEIHIDRDSGAIDATKDGVKMDPSELGRISAQTAKQVIIQKIREAERDSLFDEFEDQRGDLVTGTVQRFEGGAVIVNLGKTDGILPRGEQIPGESYHPNERIRAIILDVRKVGQRVKIILSRTHPDFVRRLFELEIPEIADQVIAIRALAREAGYRSKVAVTSIDAKIDAVGACVGVRGTRIKNIVDELGGERIDIVRWNESLQVLIPNSLQPAEIDEVMLCHLLGRAIVLVRDDQLSLAIGRRGQNVRLASKLVGWDVEIMTAEELDEVIEKAVKTFEKIDEVDTELAERLVEQGILSYDDLSVMEISDLVNTIEGLTEEQASSIVSQAETMAEEQTDELPRRKAGRAAAALAEGRDSGESPPVEVNGDETASDLASEDDGEAAAELDESGPSDGGPSGDESGIDELTDSTGMHDSALPAERGDEVEDDSSFDEGAVSESESEPEGDEASDDEYHDVALAEETSGRTAQGHEVTSPPSDDDQSETLRIVTDVVENGEAPPTTSEPELEPRDTSRPENGARGKDQKPGRTPAGE
ncbi:MAG: transcription termination factor NusA [Paludisphaera borealis]|uniref:transcription termination factor NusA n=1 Tax=Paludisphaera borealis TaxID=1387353 RepID=UPI00283D36F8|nr:transcription termination factor NusA [Paludisphaera borealis]MDR3620751.1 transcription termination factor NusA [Paludisphaera borealis]